MNTPKYLVILNSKNALVYEFDHTVKTYIVWKLTTDSKVQVTSDPQCFKVYEKGKRFYGNYRFAVSETRLAEIVEKHNADIVKAEQRLKERLEEEERRQDAIKTKRAAQQAIFKKEFSIELLNSDEYVDETNHDLASTFFIIKINRNGRFLAIVVLKNTTYSSGDTYVSYSIETGLARLGSGYGTLYGVVEVNLNNLYESVFPLFYSVIQIAE
jgi:hypothetical protein